MHVELGAGRRGGEEGEALADALVREMREETGVDVAVGRLLYACDHLPEGGVHVLHITFEARRVGGMLGEDVGGADSRQIRGVKFVEVSELVGLGFGELVRAGFPGVGSYMGLKGNIGL
ncbi:NUDIX domain-containing protein [Actinomadura terrae]|uniref:NUDIX domain-containing protein n=1 Tax=Actinomadura terrae TaxID=604353 RepID=UPI001FA78B43|nr:NUDIX hydrolase [Actinomadura terrae]